MRSCETGLVVTPFLPGDSLLFAAGALSTTTSLSAHTLAPLLLAAAVLGNSTNYFVGSWVGQRAFNPKYKKIFRPEYLEKTKRFFDKYGSKTIILAQFMPIVRTFSPFLAGVGSMSYVKFATYNIVGAVLWISIFVYAGYFFGNIPVVKKNFTLVIMAVILLSILPAVIEIIKEKRKARSR
jgi:membrane-associated protein